MIICLIYDMSVLQEAMFNSCNNDNRFKLNIEDFELIVELHEFLINYLVLFILCSYIISFIISFFILF